jgi:hypothetical protein
VHKAYFGVEISNRLRWPDGKDPTMITDRFDQRTLANMEVALERACKSLLARSEQHEARRHIASRILKCAKAGDRTLGGLTKAALRAASELAEDRVA